MVGVHVFQKFLCLEVLLGKLVILLSCVVCFEEKIHSCWMDMMNESVGKRICMCDKG